MAHSLDKHCNHNNLMDIHSQNNLMGLYFYDAYCKDCQEMVYATKGRFLCSNKIFEVPWTIHRHIGYCGSLDDYNKIVNMGLMNRMDKINECCTKATNTCVVCAKEELEMGEDCLDDIDDPELAGEVAKCNAILDILGLKLVIRHREKTSTTIERRRMNKLFEELK